MQPTENSLAGCRNALKAGADILELDVQLIDGKLLLAHDKIRPRTETLEPILAEIKAPLILHLKRRRYNPWHDRRLLDRLAPLLTGRNGNRDVVVSSFWPGTVTYAKRRYPQLRTAYATFWLGYDLWLYNRLAVDEFHAWYRTATTRAVAKAAAKNLKVVAFIAPEPPRLAALLRRKGVRSVVTDQVAGWRRA